MVADLEALRRRLGVDRLDLLGHSWGGLLVALYVAEHPDHVRSVISVDGEPLDAAVDRAGQDLFSLHVSDLQGRGLVPRTLPPDRGDDCGAAVAALLPAYLARPAASAAAARALGPTRCSEEAGSSIRQDQADGAEQRARLAAQARHWHAATPSGRRGRPRTPPSTRPRE